MGTVIWKVLWMVLLVAGCNYQYEARHGSGNIIVACDERSRWGAVVARYYSRWLPTRAEGVRVADSLVATGRYASCQSYDVTDYR